MPKIYVDIDETLLHSNPIGITEAHEENAYQKVVVVGTKPNGVVDAYLTILRPSAHKMIEDCKKLGEVNLFTSSTREYALAQNKAWGLGFDEDTILAREDYLMEIPMNYGRETIVLNEKTDPTSFLIEDLSPLSTNGKRKIAYLGIPLTNYIRIPEFKGIEDPNFLKEWGEALKKLQPKSKTKPIPDMTL